VKRALLLALMSAPTYAQTVWTDCANEGERCTITSPKEARYGEPWNDRWTAPRTLTSSFDCGNALFGDPSPGTGKRCQVRDVPGSPMPVLPWTVRWTHVTQNTDGTPLTDRTGYRVEASYNSGTFIPVSLAAGESVTLQLPAGRYCFRLITITAAAESEPSAPVCRTKVPPRAPTNFGVRQ
jgi:hypothetical protein